MERFECWWRTGEKVLSWKDIWRRKSFNLSNFMFHGFLIFENQNHSAIFCRHANNGWFDFFCHEFHSQFATQKWSQISNFFIFSLCRPTTSHTTSASNTMAKNQNEIENFLPTLWRSRLERSHWRRQIYSLKERGGGKIWNAVAARRWLWESSRKCHQAFNLAVLCPQCELARLLCCFPSTHHHHCRSHCRWSCGVAA